VSGGGRPHIGGGKGKFRDQKPVTGNVDKSNNVIREKGLMQQLQIIFGEILGN